MNISDLLGAVVQAGMSPSSKDRLRNSMGGGDTGTLEALSKIFGGGRQSAPQASGGGLGDLLSGMLGSGAVSAGAQRPASTGGGLTDLLGGLLGGTGQAQSRKSPNLALGGLGALAGALLGGGSRSARGAMGGGLMALLGTMAFQALKGMGTRGQTLPLGLRQPETRDEEQELEQKAALILKAMINAAKADGQIDKQEVNRIVGKLDEAGADEEGRQYVLAELQKPLETGSLVAATMGNPELAAEIYAASLLAIEVDTQAEKAYLDNLAAAMGLASEATQRIQAFMGMR